MKRKLLIFILFGLFISGCSCSNQPVQETELQTETESEIIKETNPIKDELLETKKNDEGKDIYINLETIPKNKLTKENQVEISEDDFNQALEDNTFVLYNTNNNQKVFDYIIPEGYELIALSGDTVLLNNKENKVGFYITVLDQSVEDTIQDMQDNMEGLKSYIRNSYFSSDKELSLSGINCRVLLKVDTYDAETFIMETTPYCFFEYLGNPVQITIASDENYILSQGADLLSFEASSEMNKCLRDQTYFANTYCKELLTGINYN